MHDYKYCAYLKEMSEFANRIIIFKREIKLFDIAYMEYSFYSILLFFKII